MKTTINFATLATLVLLLTASSAFSQVTPTTTGVTIFCDGSDLVLPAPAAGTEYVVRYSATATDTPTENVALTGGTTIPSASLATGYYYVSTQGDATNPTVCESDMTPLPVYKFAPLTVSFTAADYCIEDVGTQEFTGTVESTDPYTTFTYQWYTVADGVETAIAEATESTYQPSADIAPGTTTMYRLKAGYLVEGLRYCSDIHDVAVTVTAKPAAPTITIEGATGETL